LFNLPIAFPFFVCYNTRKYNFGGRAAGREIPPDGGEAM
jgi:hypothetical protein